IAADTAVLYDVKRMPIGLYRTFEHGGKASRLFDLAGGGTFTTVSLGENLPQLADLLRGADQTVPTDLLGALSERHYLGDEIGLLMEKPDTSRSEAGDAYTPRLLFAFRLTEEGIDASADLQMLAELTFSKVIKKTSLEYLMEYHGDHQVVRFFQLKNPPEPGEQPDFSEENNGVPGLLSTYLGGDANPACAVVRTDAGGAARDGYFLLATNRDYLYSCLDAWDASASRFRSLGGAGGVAMSYFTQGPTFFKCMIDADEMFNGYYSDDGIRLASSDSGTGLRSSERIELRARAAKEAGPDNPDEEERLYKEYERKALLQKTAERNLATNNLVDRRKLMLLTNWLGIEVRPIGKPGELKDRCAVRLVASFG
ncbi:MAG: hypothetical protein AB7K09_10580, partial [Planctomycetota bacterium]